MRQLVSSVGLVLLALALGWPSAQAQVVPYSSSQAASQVSMIDNSASWRGMEHWLKQHGYDEIANSAAGGRMEVSAGLQKALFVEWYNPTLQRRAVITHSEFFDDLAVAHTYENIQFFWTENGAQKTGDCYWDPDQGVVEVTAADAGKSWLIFANQWAICSLSADAGSAVGCLFTGPGYLPCLAGGVVGGAVACAVGVALNAVIPH